MQEAPRRTDDEARRIFEAELSRLSARRAELGEGGVFAVAGYALVHAMEWEAALLAWRGARSFEPDDCELAYSEAMCLLELSRWSDAAAAFRAVIDLDRRIAESGGDGVDWIDADPAYRLGTALHAAGDLDGALAAYEESARRNTIMPESLREIVRVRLARKEGSLALEAVARLEARAFRPSVRAEAAAFREEALALADDAQRGS
ncbi:MAG: hypothetical protein HMLKMBBP_03103 [Planctomycetes bacterium]|nr:hypothetical protein [Planctomycetota bacterium]